MRTNHQFSQKNPQRLSQRKVRREILLIPFVKKEPQLNLTEFNHNLTYHKKVDIVLQ